MCGRTACTLDPTNICMACSYQKQSSSKDTSKYTIPEWRDHPGDFKYYPSYNVAPTSFTPVIISDNKGNRVIQPMKWGMIPPWHKGTDSTGHGVSTNNCRVEGLMTSKLYSGPFKKGQRCVVLCDGFYEWQTTKESEKVKQPYFIYSEQQSKVKVEDSSTWIGIDDLWNEDVGWKGIKLLAMAGIYNKWKSAENEVIYSYTVITMESNKTLNWLHHRMPAILDTDKAVQDWIDNGNIDSNEAFKLLITVDKLSWHPVSTNVNYVKNKEDTCNKPIELKPKTESASSRFMSAWLKKTPKDSKETVEPEKKKLKLEQEDDLS